MLLVAGSGRLAALGTLTQEDWYRGFASVAGKEEEGTLRILALEITGVVPSI